MNSLKGKFCILCKSKDTLSFPTSWSVSDTFDEALFILNELQQTHSDQAFLIVKVEYEDDPLHMEDLLF